MTDSKWVALALRVGWCRPPSDGLMVSDANGDAGLHTQCGSHNLRVLGEVTLDGVKQNAI